MRFAQSFTFFATLLSIATSANAAGVDFKFLSEAFRIGTKPKIHELAGEVFTCREFIPGKTYATNHYELSFQYDSSSTLRVNGHRIYRAPSLEISAPTYNETYRYTDRKSYLTVKVTHAGKVTAYATCKYSAPASNSAPSSGVTYGTDEGYYVSSSSDSSSDSSSSSSSTSVATSTSSSSSNSSANQNQEPMVTVGSNGVIYTHTGGSTIVGSNGVVYQNNGGFVVGSDGSTCTHGFPNCP